MTLASSKIDISVADPGCLCGSGMFIFDPGSPILDPDFYLSRIPNPGSRIQKQQQKRGVKKICFHTFFCSHKFHIIENYLIFEMLKQKIWGNFQRINELFTQKIVTNLSKTPDPGSPIRIRNTDRYTKIYY